MAHVRAARLLELLGLMQTCSRFTAVEMAERLGVSRRTILRDIQELERLGVAIESTPGPGGGYRVPFGRRRLSMSFTLNEAMALIVGYEAMSTHYVTPLSDLSWHGITKIQAALPAEKTDQLAHWRQHLSLRTLTRKLSIPYLDQLFDAAVEGHRLLIVYEAVNTPARNLLIDPVGLYAEHGLWYCACRHGARDIGLRADRVVSIIETRPFQRLPDALSNWFARREQATQWMTIQFQASDRGMKRHELATLIERGDKKRTGADSWQIDCEIEANDIEYWADRFVAMGCDARVEVPQILIEAVCKRIDALALAYKR